MQFYLLSSAVVHACCAPSSLASCSGACVRPVCHGMWLMGTRRTKSMRYGMTGYKPAITYT